MLSEIDSYTSYTILTLDCGCWSVSILLDVVRVFVRYVSY